MHFLFKDQLVIPTIYFYARAPASLSLSTGQTVVYTTVEANEGQGYDPSSGRFTVSVPGLYSFAVQFCTENQKTAYLEIVNQYKTLQKSSFEDQNVNGNYLSVSMQVFTKADVSDQIWVKSSDFTTSAFQNDDVFRRNSFTGALVHV
ncbi:hypothetical protein DPMN_135782 [Dreissena polymorpha]|uniref:C1q domain-containing protein n=1 Tax=Dreissena polymorpha TaxID=45954 RepID=A0A9D4JC14_DREPO|nr:hypothetical protein DPMN_135782 [Dreissena polymorpha]